MAGGTHAGPSLSYTFSSVRLTMSWPVSASNRPYPDSLSLLRTAIWRVATLCACDPVKYCSAAPQASSLTTRRSACSSAATVSFALAMHLVCRYRS